MHSTPENYITAETRACCVWQRFSRWLGFGGYVARCFIQWNTVAFTHAVSAQMGFIFHKPGEFLIQIANCPCNILNNQKWSTERWMRQIIASSFAPIIVWQQCHGYLITTLLELEKAMSCREPWQPGSFEPRLLDVFDQDQRCKALDGQHPAELHSWSLQIGHGWIPPEFHCHFSVLLTCEDKTFIKIGEIKSIWTKWINNQLFCTLRPPIGFVEFITTKQDL